MAVDADVPDFDLLGDLDLVPAGALQSAEGPNTQPDIPQPQQQQQQSVAAVKQQRSTIRLPSLAVNATKAASASLSSSRTTPKGCQPLLPRDLNDDSSCLGSGTASDAKHKPLYMQQTAQRGAGFIAPRRQPASERPVHRLQAASFPHAQQSSSVAQNETTNSLSGASGADFRGAHTPAPTRRQSSSNSGDNHHAAGTGAVPHSTAAASAPPSEVTPLQASDQRRQSGSGAKSHRRTSSGKRPMMRRMYTDEDPLAEKLSAEDQALLEADVPVERRTSAAVHMQQWDEDPSAASDTPPPRALKRLRKAGTPMQGVETAHPDSVDKQLPDGTAAGESACRDVAGGAAPSATCDTPMPAIKRRQNPFVRSSRKGSKPVRLAQAAAAQSVPAAKLHSIMTTAHMPEQDLSSDEEADAWPETNTPRSTGAATGAKAALQHLKERRASASASSATRVRLQPQHSDDGAAAAPADGDPTVAAEVRAAAAAAGIDLTGCDGDERACSREQQRMPRQKQRTSGSHTAAHPQQQQWGAGDAGGRQPQAGRQPGWGNGGAAGAQQTPAQQPAAKAGLWRQPSDSSPWQGQAPDGSGGGGQAWWHRIPGFLPVGAIDNGCDPRTGDTIYVDYLRQFSGEKAPRAAPGTASRGPDAVGDHGSTPGGGADAGGSRKGRWSTVGGSKVYISASGKRMTGSAAYKAYDRDKKGEAGGSCGGGSGVPKRRTSKKVKGSRTGGRRRKH